MIRSLICLIRGHTWVSRGLFFIGQTEDGEAIREEWFQCERCEKWE
jgi:hypothetical protein